MNGEGRRNLAPFSFFGGIASSPPLVGVSIGRRRGIKKDSLRNLEETGEGVIHIPTKELAERMVLSSGDYPPEVDEFELTGLTPEPSLIVRPPRIAEAPLALECKVERIIELGEAPEGLVILRIVLYRVRDDLLEEGRICPERLGAIGRLGGAGYCVVDHIFTIERPDTERELERWMARVQSPGNSGAEDGESRPGIEGRQ
jgi:flavin reductase (DIM6/NTAB) family NADH-FMN oxidoreductase RutF